MNITDDNILSIIFSFIPRKNKDWLHLRLVNKQFLKLCKKVQNPVFNNYIYGFTTCCYPLFFAIKNDHVSCIKELLDDNRIELYHESVIGYICKNSSLITISEIYNHNKLYQLFENFIYESICDYDRIDILEFCLEKKIYMNQQKVFGFALWTHSIKVLKKLISFIEITESIKNSISVWIKFEHFYLTQEPYKQVYELIKDF